MRLTFVHPAIGRKRGDTRYIGTWQMEPLPVAALAGLTPAGVDVRFHDDRVEPIPFDEPTDLVALSVETYTFRRAAQIASEYRRRGVPVVMGGFHATLRPQDAARYAETVVVGEAEGVWSRLIDDFRHGRPEPLYQGGDSGFAQGTARYDRRLFRGKRYLPLGLVETARGCRFRCSFCAIQSFFERRAARRDLDGVLAELTTLKSRYRFFFFVDDNFAGDPGEAKAFMRALAPLKLRWVTQMSIDAAHDEEFLALARQSGCRGALIGFESLDRDNLRAMGKAFNAMRGGYATALVNLKRHGLRVYGTFTFGHDHDREDSFDAAADFALSHDFYLAAFNHLTPFPGTPLYAQLEREGRLRYPAWWLDPAYRYNDVPFHPAGIGHDAVRRGCLRARRRFYSWASIARRFLGELGGGDAFMARNHLLINTLHRREVSQRDGFPLGDEGWNGTLIEAG
jgi:radical SAM superfamily enzyme YgiQ (UPF0313 family)